MQIEMLPCRHLNLPVSRVPGGRENILKWRYMGKHIWLRYSVAIASIDQHSLHDEKLKQKVVYCQFMSCVSIKHRWRKHRVHVSPSHRK